MVLTIEIEENNFESIAPIISEKISEILRNKNYIDNDIEKNNIVKNFIGKGNFSFVYKNLKNEIIKKSFILSKTNDLIIKQNIDKDTIKKLIYEFDNEILQSLEFSKLKNYFPLNIVQIYDTHTVFLKNCTFPFNFFKIEYMDGPTLNKYLSNLNIFNEINNFKLLLKVTYETALLFLSINKMGFYHNDVNFSNIIIHKIKNTNQCVPVLIDYSFSKKINSNTFYPIETCIFLNQIKKFIKSESFYKFYILLEDKINDLLNDFFNLMILIDNLNHRYKIYDSVFMEKIFFNSGIFTENDFKYLLNINPSDLETLKNKINLNNNLILL